MVHDLSGSHTDSRLTGRFWTVPAIPAVGTLPGHGGTRNRDRADGTARSGRLQLSEPAQRSVWLGQAKACRCPASKGAILLPVAPSPRTSAAAAGRRGVRGPAAAA